jgi:uncharacterized protein DUF1236
MRREKPMNQFLIKTIVAASLSVSAPLSLSGAWAQAPAGGTPPLVVSPKVNLTLEQRDTIRELVKDLNVGSASSDTPVAIGDTVPKQVELHPMPPRVGEKVSQIKNHLFFRKDTQVAIVDPKDNKIVDVIN